jgi:hypothetical protein
MDTQPAPLARSKSAVGYTSVTTHAALEDALDSFGLAGIVIYALEFTESELERVLASDVSGTVFAGCSMPSHAQALVIEKGAVLFPKLQGLPYIPIRSDLYTIVSVLDALKLAGVHYAQRKYPVICVPLFTRVLPLAGRASCGLDTRG